MATEDKKSNLEIISNLDFLMTPYVTSYIFGEFTPKGKVIPELIFTFLWVLDYHHFDVQASFPLKSGNDGPILESTIDAYPDFLAECGKLSWESSPRLSKKSICLRKE